MTHYSVWNYDTKRYDYYVDGARSGTHAPAPPRARGPKGDLGATPDQSAWPLPKTARKVGSGSVARGRVASLGDFTDLGPSAIMLGLAGIALYFAFKSSKRGMP